MCGIAGFSGAFDKELLIAMSERITHRGPDDDGIEMLADSNNLVGLAHRRLSIIDLSADAHQPMTVTCSNCQSSHDKPLWLIYNGELYNYRQLRAELIAAGHRFTSESDTEVLLHLYAQYGVDMLKKMNGIFAFAIFDGRKKPGELFIARDGLGVKPLYYAQTPAGFIFASELKALLACDKLERKIDYTALHYYLAYLWSPGERTALTAIKKLQPGEALIVRNGEVSKRWYYYDIPYAKQTANLSRREQCAQLDKNLQQAVERQLVADVPVGAFLSGGLDSSAIVAMMRRLQPNTPISCYTIGFKEGMASEGNPNDIPYAREVARHLKVDLQVMEMGADIIDNLEHMIYHLDEPQADPAPLHVYSIAKAARADGIKVLLSGAGGDDIFSGYRRHQAMQLERFWRFVPTSTRENLAFMANQILDGNSQNYNSQQPLTRRIAKLLAPVDLSAERRLVHHFLWSTEGLRRDLYSTNMSRHLDDIDTAMPLLQTLQRIPSDVDPLNRMLYLETKHFLPDHNLNYTDKMSMAAGVEVRVPLLDTDLVAQAAGIPTRFKQRGKTSKAIFKQAMEPYLPKSVIYRPKAGFGAPLRHWLTHELQPLVHDVLSPKSVNERGLFNSKAVNNLIAQNQRGAVDASYTIFSLVCIEMWCRKFL